MLLHQTMLRLIQVVGSGCGAVGRAVASDTRGSVFEPSNFIKNIYKLLTVWRGREWRPIKRPSKCSTIQDNLNSFALIYNSASYLLSATFSDRIEGRGPTIQTLHRFVGFCQCDQMLDYLPNIWQFTAK